MPQKKPNQTNKKPTNTKKPKRKLEQPTLKVVTRSYGNRVIITKLPGITNVDLQLLDKSATTCILKTIHSIQSSLYRQLADNLLLLNKNNRLVSETVIFFFPNPKLERIY